MAYGALSELIYQLTLGLAIIFAFSVGYYQTEEWRTWNVFVPVVLLPLDFGNLLRE